MSVYNSHTRNINLHVVFLFFQHFEVADLQESGEKEKDCLIDRSLGEINFWCSWSYGASSMCLPPSIIFLEVLFIYTDSKIQME